MTPAERRTMNTHMRNLANEIKSAANAYSQLRSALADVDRDGVEPPVTLRGIAYRADEAARTTAAVQIGFRNVCSVARRIERYRTEDDKA